MGWPSRITALFGSNEEFSMDCSDCAESETTMQLEISTSWGMGLAAFGGRGTRVRSICQFGDEDWICRIPKSPPRGSALIRRLTTSAHRAGRAGSYPHEL